MTSKAENIDSALSKTAQIAAERFDHVPLHRHQYIDSRRCFQASSATYQLAILLRLQLRLGSEYRLYHHCPRDQRVGLMILERCLFVFLIQRSSNEQFEVVSDISSFECHSFYMCLSLTIGFMRVWMIMADSYMTPRPLRAISD